MWAPVFSEASIATRVASQTSIDPRPSSFPTTTPQLAVEMANSQSWPSHQSCCGRYLTWNISKYQSIFQPLESDMTLLCYHKIRPQPYQGPITYILWWLECYSSLVAALAMRYLQYIGDFMPYQRTIIRASRNFEGAAWVLYDHCYRCRAAATKSLEWGNTDSALYNELFTGRAQSIAQYHLRPSDNHLEAGCPNRAPPVQVQGCGHRFTGRTSSQGRPLPQSEVPVYRGPSCSVQSGSQEVCQLFN